MHVCPACFRRPHPESCVLISQICKASSMSCNAGVYLRSEQHCIVCSAYRTAGALCALLGNILSVCTAHSIV